MFRRIKDVWDLGGEIEKKTKGCQVFERIKETKHTEKISIGIALEGQLPIIPLRPPGQLRLTAG